MEDKPMIGEEVLQQILGALNGNGMQQAANGVYELCAYVDSNMLFDIVLNNTNMSRELRYNVYETLFGEHITDRQIKDICDGIDNDALSDEFLSYITERFEQSTEEEDIKFHFVCAVVKAKVSVNNGINPLRTAENLLVSGKKDSERLLGLYMISVITWCQYNNINTSFSDCGCTDIHKIIMSLLDCLDSNNLLLVEAASVAMKDMCIAEHFEDSEDYWYTIIKMEMKTFMHIILN